MPSGIETADYTDANRHDYREPEAQVGFEQAADCRCSLQEFDGGGTEQDAHEAAEKSEQGGLAENHSDDARTFPANGKQNRDFMRARKRS